MINILSPRVNCLKTIPFTAAHTYMVHIWLYPPPPPPAVIVLAGKLASKQRRGNCNTTLYLSPKSFDENNLSDVTTR